MFSAVPPEVTETIALPSPADSPFDVWDLIRAPTGHLYASVSPMHEPGFPRLYRYDAARSAVELVFDLEEVTFLDRRTIPASKIHTSMAFADDSTLYLVTHTTARAPDHRLWAPLSSYHDIYEGFPGSHFVKVDVRRGDARCLGVPIPRESLWGGGCYLEETREYLAIGLLRGHLYSFRVDDLAVTDLGYVGRGCRLFQDEQGRAYGVAPVGRDARAIMYRYDPGRRAVEDLDIDLPRSRGASLAFAKLGPDGRTYLVRNFYDPFWDIGDIVESELTDHIFAFDPKRGTIENLGSAFPDAGDYPRPRQPKIPWRIVVAPTFLNDGRLYYGVLGANLDGLVALMRWNVTGGDAPEFLGFLHADGRAVPFVWDGVAGSDGRLYVAEASAGVFNTRAELIAMDAMSISAPTPSAFELARRAANPTSFDEAIRDRARRFTAGADLNLGRQRTGRIELYDRLLGADECGVRGMIRSTMDTLCLATQAGALVMWDGRTTWVGGWVEGPVSALASDGAHVVVATDRTLWRLELPRSRFQTVRLERRITLCGDDRFTAVRVWRTKVYGLIEPGAVPFCLAGSDFTRGPATRSVRGSWQTLWVAGDGAMLSAQDGGSIYAWQPGGALRETGAVVPSTLGRRFLCRWTAACAVKGTVIGGSADGYLFEYRAGTKSTRNLGKPALSLGIRDLTSDGDCVYGIAGRPGDLCTVFGYSHASGFVDYGVDVTQSMELSALVSLGDGRVAIAEDGRAAQVGIYDLARPRR